MLKLIPNILTLGRLVLTIVFLVMIFLAPPYYADGEVPFPGFLDIAFILFVIAGLTDIADGIAARRLNVASKFGRMVDPLADKILVCGAFICFALIGQPKLFNLGPGVLTVIHWSVAGILIAREVYVTVLRHIAESRGVNGNNQNGPRPDCCLGILVHIRSFHADAGNNGHLRHQGHTATTRLKINLKGKRLLKNHASYHVTILVVFCSALGSFAG